MNKKIISILVILLILIVLILGVLILRKDSVDTNTGFLGLFSGSGTNLPTSGDQPTTGDSSGGATSTTPLLGDNRLFQLTTFPALGKLLEDRVVYYRRDLGHRYFIDTDGENEERVSNFTIPAVTSVSIADEGRVSVLLSLESEVSPSFFSLQHTGTSTAALLLPSPAVAAAVSPDGESVVFLEELESGSRVILSSPSLTDQTVLYNDAFKDFEISWVDASHILLSSRPSAFRPGAGILININGTSSSLLDPMPALDINFSKNGTSYLYSTIEEEILTLRVASLLESSSATIPVRTFAEKCAWSTETIVYCATPLPTGDENSVFPDDWLKGNVRFDDVLWKIDIENGTAEHVADMFGFDIVHLFANESFLLFNNKNDSTLWSLQLYEDVLPSPAPEGESDN